MDHELLHRGKANMGMSMPIDLDVHRSMSNCACCARKDMPQA
jgi:hypothetical protein